MKTPVNFRYYCDNTSSPKFLWRVDLRNNTCAMATVAFAHGWMKHDTIREEDLIHSHNHRPTTLEEAKKNFPLAFDLR